MDRIGFAIALNNEGVTKLHHGKISQAMELFRRSLNEMKSMMKMIPQQQQQQQPENVPATSMARHQIRLAQQAQGQATAAAAVASQQQQQQSSFCPLRQPQPQRHYQQNHARRLPSSSSSSTCCPPLCLHSATIAPLQGLRKDANKEEGFIFSHPLLLNHMTVKEICSYRREHVLNIYSSCVVFNLALAYHVSSKAVLNRRKHDLKKAGQMYALVLKLLRRKDYNQNAGSVNILLLSSMNNLSHILFFDLGEHHRALEGFKKVGVLLSTSSNRMSSTSSTRHDEQEQQQGRRRCRNTTNGGDNNNDETTQQNHPQNNNNNNSKGRMTQGLQAKDKSGFMWNICMLKAPRYAAAA